MRSLQECQAEVFRRSEKRIKERKKRRKHILMLCIPLVLCLTTIGSFLLSGVRQDKSTDLAAPEMVTKNLYAGSGDIPMDGVFCDSVTESTQDELKTECSVGNATAATDTHTPEAQVPYCAQYVRTDGPHDGVVFPCVRIVDSLQELKDYYTKWHDQFHLERRDTVSSDSTPGFLDVCDQYDEAFFTENYLLFVLLEEYSGSIRHEVRSVEQTTEGLLSISIDRKVPEVGTDDMAQWHIIFELSREYLVESSLETMIFLDGLPN